ncbi:MAG: thiolase domain-containing protein [Candidatus Bathyarchaeota archaeon]|nr:MAG: thiolase domain-containing protein [Candidatus Bathyarchaeota archaeon]
MREVAIVGVGCTGFKSVTPEISYKEMMFEAATRAYQDAGNINPRKDIDAFISVAEDYWEGFSIFDEFVPDQLGAVLRHLFTVSGDSIIGLATAYMLIKTGYFNTVALESHGKPSDILTLHDIVSFAMDPILNRPLGGHPFYVAGMEMNRFLCTTGNTRDQCAMIVAKNKGNALSNAFAAYGANVDVEDVLNSDMQFYPLKKIEISKPADGGIVIILASDKVATKLNENPVWIKGVGWASETPSLETRCWSKAIYARLAAEMAYKKAGIMTPSVEVDFAEVDDLFSYKELQHMEALKLCRSGEAGKLTEEGITQLDGYLPINPSGGMLGMGWPLEAAGLQRLQEVVLQLRGQAGNRQLSDVEIGVAQSWRGIPTATGAVAVLSNYKG